MFSRVTSSARSPSQTKMMTFRAAGPTSCWGAARPLPDPSKKNDRALKNTSILIVMVLLVFLMASPPSFQEERVGILSVIPGSRVDDPSLYRRAQGRGALGGPLQRPVGRCAATN